MATNISRIKMGFITLDCEGKPHKADGYRVISTKIKRSLFVFRLENSLQYRIVDVMTGLPITPWRQSKRECVADIESLHGATSFLLKKSDFKTVAIIAAAYNEYGLEYCPGVESKGE